MNPNKTSYRTHSNAFLSLVLLAAVTACEASTSSSTHWLRCEALSDCATVAAVDCKAGYCLDKNGDQISSSDSGPSHAGAGSSGASSTTSNATSTTGGRGGTVATSIPSNQGGAVAGGATSNGASTSGSVSGSNGGSPAAGESGVAVLGGVGNSAGGAVTSSRAGSNAQGGAAGNGGSSNHAGGVSNSSGSKGIAGGTSLGGTSGAAGSSSGAAGICSVSPEFLEPLKACNIDADCEKQRYQVNCCGTNAWVAVRSDKVVDLLACLATRPAFPMCGCASTGDTVEDGRLVSYNGSDVAARCVNHRCETRVTTRNCGTTAPTTCAENQLCVSYETTVGPASNVEYACVTNPCSDDLSCSCAQSVCNLRTDTTRTCNQQVGAAAPVFLDIRCQDNRQ